MSTVVDAHQHFWSYGSYQTAWMEQPPYVGDPVFAAIRRSFTPSDLRPLLTAAGVKATIAVQAGAGDAENAALLTLARAHDWIAGVVGWLPLDRPAEVERRLAALQGERKLVGVRHQINDEPDPDWIRRPAVIDGLRAVARHGLAFDYLGILPRHLENLVWLAAQLPGLRIVLDHLGKPPLASGQLSAWRGSLAAVAAAPNVYAKLSGLDAGPGDSWTAVDIAPCVEAALALFGPQRLLFGSDWPLAELRGGYDKVWRETASALAGLAPDERRAVLGGTACDVYRLGPELLAVDGAGGGN